MILTGRMMSFGDGVFFIENPDDPAIWVDKRTGIGWTLNFAHLESWIIILMILAVPAGFFDTYDFGIG
jgi:uncharacterized membrane protein